MEFHISDPLASLDRIAKNAEGSLTRPSDAVTITTASGKNSDPGATISPVDPNLGYTPPPPPPPSPEPEPDCGPLLGRLPGNSSNPEIILPSNIIPSHLKNMYVNGVNVDQNEPLLTQSGNFSHDVAGPFQFNSTANPSGFGKLMRPVIAQGTAIVIPFKTAAAYNVQQFFRNIDFSDYPGTQDGVGLVTVSRCPGDFTSMLPTAADFTPEGNLKLPARRNAFFCAGPLLPFGGGLIIGMGYENICNLQPGKRYYINITPGFQKNGPPAGLTTMARLLAYGPYVNASNNSWDIHTWGLKPDALGLFGGLNTAQPIVKVISGIDNKYDLIRSTTQNWYNAARYCQQQASNLAVCQRPGNPTACSRAYAACANNFPITYPN